MCSEVILGEKISSISFLYLKLVTDVSLAWQAEARLSPCPSPLTVMVLYVLGKMMLWCGGQLQKKTGQRHRTRLTFTGNMLFLMNGGEYFHSVMNN